MLKTIMIAVITCITTSIDEIPVLYMLYKKASNRGKAKSITITYILSSLSLVVLSLLGAMGIVQLPFKWIIGLVGLIPIGMGIRTLFDNDEDEAETFVAVSKYKSLWVQVFVIVMTLGADDISVYLPLFTTVSGWGIIQLIIVIITASILLCILSYRLTRIEYLSKFIEKREKYIEGIIFVAIGIYVMIEGRTISVIIDFIIHR